MWIDSDNLLTPTVGFTDKWQPLSEEASLPVSLVLNDDKDKPRDALAAIHESLRSSTQLSEQEEKKHFTWLGDLVQQLVLELLRDSSGREWFTTYLTSVASDKNPLDLGLRTSEHRLLMTDIKQIIKSLDGKPQVADLARRIERLNDGPADIVDITELTLIDWPHQLILAIAQSQYAISQPGQCSSYLKAFSNYLAAIPESGVSKVRDEKGTPGKRLLTLVKNYYKCRNYLVHHNLRLVYHVAKKHSLSPGEIPDIFQEGVFGLIRAIEKYRPQSGYRFSTYAYNWVDAKTRLAPVRHKGFMRLPTSTIADLNVLRRTATDLQSQGSVVNPVSVASSCDLSESRVKTLLELNNFALSLDQPLLDRDQEMTLSGVIADADQEVEEQVWEGELKTVVDQLLTTLTDREAFILIHRFGLKGVPAQSLEIVSSNIGLSRERVRQIEKKILAELRELVESQQVDIKDGLWLTQ